jgi:hypothetical protein
MFRESESGKPGRPRCSPQLGTSERVDEIPFSGQDRKRLHIGDMNATSAGGEQVQFAPGVRATAMTV